MKTTTENNKIIAEFMDVSHLYSTVRLETLKYNTDWNWLIEVVEKIESHGFTFEIKKNWASITKKGEKIVLRWEEDRTKIEATYNACVAFIKWYNEQNK